MSDKCSRCGRTLTETEPGHLIYPAWGLYLCDLCFDKSEQCSPEPEQIERFNDGYPQP